MVDPLNYLLFSGSAPQRLWYVLSYLWDGAYKKQRVAHVVVAVGFLSHYMYMNGPLPYV